MTKHLPQLKSVVNETADDTFDATQLELLVVGAGATPADVLALRKEIYTDETGMLASADLAGPKDEANRHICLYYPLNGKRTLIATLTFAGAEACDFAHHTDLPQAALTRGCYMSRGMVRPAFRRRSLLALMIYLAGREARIAGRDLMYAYMTEGEPPARQIVRYQLIEQVPPRIIKGNHGTPYTVVAAWSDMAYAMHRCYAALNPDVQEFLYASGLLGEEVEQVTRARLQKFFGGPWFQRLHAGTLTKEQYVSTLSNMHQFVRWTTRLLGRMVSLTSDAELRRHYLSHLEGEVDHELMLENDLKHLGADVDFVVNYMVPTVQIQEYMCVQESMAAFHQDPVLFLAVPFAIEGLSGHLPKDFGPALARCIAAWGADPRQVTSFLSSHVHTDGGVDGHWEHSRLMIRKHVRTETQVQRFLNVVNLITNSLDRAYASYVSLPQFSTTAADLERGHAHKPAA